MAKIDAPGVTHLRYRVERTADSYDIGAGMPPISQQAIPGYAVGTWDIDPMHSDVGLTVRHLMVSKVRGRFARFHGTIETREDLTASDVAVTIDATSIETGQPQRDDHGRSADFFDVEHHPTWTFGSTGLRAEGDHHVLDGELTIKGTTRPVSLQLEINGFGPEASGADHGRAVVRALAQRVQSRETDDLEKVTALAQELAGRGISVWFDDHPGRTNGEQA